MGERAARATGLVLLVGVSVLLVNGVLLDAAVRTADGIYSLRDQGTPGQVAEPTTPLRSGSPDSVVAWDDLGREGRVFVGRGPAADDIAAFTGEAAEDPIRIYAGIASAEDVEERATLAVDDLERAGGFDRARAARGDHDGHRLGGAGVAGLLRVHRRRATRPRSPCSTPTCRRGCRSSSTRTAPGPPDARCSTPSTSAGARSRGTTGRGSTSSGRAWVLRRRDRLQRGVRPAQPHVRCALRRSAELQPALPQLRRRPRRRLPRGRAGLPRRADDPLQQPAA